MLENWAKLSGFAAIFAAALCTSFLWALNYVPPQNVEWACETNVVLQAPSNAAPKKFTCHTKQAKSLNGQAAETNTRGDQNASDNVKITDVFLAIFNALLVIATALLIAVGISQGRELRRAVDASKDEFVASHRPKIRLKHIWLNEDIWTGKPIIVTLVCVNTGTAEARLQEVGLRYEIVPEGATLPPAPDIAAVYQAGGASLRCGLNVRFPLIDIGRVLTSDESAAVQNKRAKLFCVGYISYVDEAQRMRITGFCRVLEFPFNALIRAENSRFRVFDDADYEYED